MGFDASSDHKESNASAGIGSNDGDSRGSDGDYGQFSRSVQSSPSYGGPEDSGRAGANQFGLNTWDSFTRSIKSQWDGVLDKLSQPKALGRLAGLLIGGPQFGIPAGLATGWAFDKISKMDINMPSWSRPATDFTSSGNNMSPSSNDGGSRQYLDQQKARIQGIQQQAWMSYLHGQDPKKKPAISDDTYKGLLS